MLEEDPILLWSEKKVLYVQNPNPNPNPNPTHKQIYFVIYPQNKGRGVHGKLQSKKEEERIVGKLCVTGCNSHLGQ